MAFELLEKYRRWILNCQQCSTCQKGPQNPFAPTGATPDRICPSYDTYRRLTYSAQGRILAARAFLEGKLEVTDDFVESLYECTLCGACGPERMGRASCCVDRKHVPIFRNFRTDLVNMGKGPTKPYKKIAVAIKDTGNRFGAKVRRDKWVPEGMSTSKKADIAFFAGCVASFKTQKIAQATVSILAHSGIEFAVLQDEWCCGNPLVDSGQRKDFESVVRHNADQIEETGAKRVMTSCACCYNVLKFRYPEIVGDLDFEVVHSSELFAGLMDEGKIKPEKSITGKMTYQDPCHLTRLGTPGAPVFEEPRKIINSIPGIEFVEMEGNGEYTQCCGRNPVELPELSLHTGINRIKDAQAVGADTIVTACSFCDWSLSRASKTLDSDIKTLDLSVLLARAMEVAPEVEENKSSFLY